MIAPALLEHTELLTGISERARALLASRGVERRYRTGQVLFRAGEPARGWFVVIEGRIRVTRETVVVGTSFLDRLVFGTVRSRLAQFIGERSARSVGELVSLGLTQRQLADELGTVREVVVKVLASLAGSGVIRVAGGGRVEVLDRVWLARIARGEEAPAVGKPARKRVDR